MQIPTSSFYDRTKSQLGSLGARANDIQSEISSGKKLVVASDDAVGYLRLRALKLDGADDTAYTANLKLADSVITQANTALDAMTKQVQRASELATQARNGTLNATDRTAIGEELASIQASLVDLANGRDVRGQYLFGGNDGAAAVTRNPDGSFTYATSASAAIPTGPSSQVQPGEPASRFLAAGGRDVLATIGALAAAFRDGSATDASMGAAIDQLTAASGDLATTQGVMGARAARVDLEQATLKSAAATREEVRSGIEDTDVTSAIVELQKTMTILQASQASFGKLSGLSLFDYLR